jgi:hypothetical protein
MLAQCGVVGVSLAGEVGEQLLGELLAEGAPCLPVHHAEVMKGRRRLAYVVAGSLLASGASVAAVGEELARVGADLEDRLARGAALDNEVEH